MIIKLCSAFFFSYYFVEIAMIPGAIKKGFKMMPGSRIKPFDCVTCLSSWIAVVLYFLPMNVSEFLFVMFGAGFLGSKIK